MPLQRYVHADETEAMHAWRTQAISRVNEAQTQKIEVLTRRLLYCWPRWQAPPPDEPADLITSFGRGLEGARATGGSPARFV